MSVRSEVWRRKMMRSQLKEVESPRIIMFEVCAAKWDLLRYYVKSEELINDVDRINVSLDVGRKEIRRRKGFIHLS